MLMALLMPLRLVPLRALHARADVVSLTAMGSFELDLFSPARVSIFTRILKRHDDGCHDVASLHQTVSFGDRLLLARIPANRFAAAGVVRPSRTAEPIKQHAELTVTEEAAGADEVPLDETNMVVRALACFRTRLAQRDGGSLDVPRFRAHLIKRIPPGVGLGGGASNAATAMWGANELCGRPASAEELTAWSEELGSGVACLLAGEGAALCTGRALFYKPPNVRAVGPLVRPDVQPAGGSSAPHGLTIITPIGGARPSTPRLFRALADTDYSTLSQAAPKDLLEGLVALDEGQAGPAPSDCTASFDSFVNDLEPPTLACSTTLGVIRHHLLEVEGFRAASLLGAGPSIAAIGQPRGGGDALAQRLERACAETGEAGAALSIHVRGVQFARRSDKQWYTELSDQLST